MYKGFAGRRKDGFQGKRAAVLPTRVVDMAEDDQMVSSLCVTDMGYYPCAEHHYRDRTAPTDQHVLIYCVDGSGYYKLGKQTFKVGRHQYFTLPAGVPPSQYKRQRRTAAIVTTNQ